MRQNLQNNKLIKHFSCLMFSKLYLYKHIERRTWLPNIQSKKQTSDLQVMGPSFLSIKGIFF